MQKWAVKKWFGIILSFSLLSFSGISATSIIDSFSRQRVNFNQYFLQICVLSLHGVKAGSNLKLLFLVTAMTVTHEQHEAVKNQRKLELQQRQEIFQWADDPTLYHLPGCMKAEISTLPKDVQFTQEGADDLHNAKQKALANLGLIKLFNLFDSWDDFDDYRKV